MQIHVINNRHICIKGVQEKYDDLKNVREYVSDMFGTLLAPFFFTLN